MPDPTQVLRTDPLENLLTILLRQFRWLLAERGVDLSDAQIKAVVQAIADKSSEYADQRTLIRRVMGDIVDESVNLLKTWNLTFAQSLKSDLNAIPGWETTEEFLDIANRKSNAELRIAVGSALAVALGEVRYAAFLLDVIAHDPHIEDADAVFAMRILLFVTGVDGITPDWLEQVKAWLDGQS